MNKQEAIKYLEQHKHLNPDGRKVLEESNEAIDMAIEALKDDWVPFTFRPPTEEEKEMWPYWDEVCDSETPEDGQEVLISYKGDVFVDVFYNDEFIGLESGGAIEESMAWRPLPEPYKESEE